MSRRGLAAAVALAMLASLAAPAAASPTSQAAELEALSLEELLTVKVTVPSLTAKPLRESPGVVTVVTREEILEVGARSLIDVLRLVPGFDFGVDVQGGIGPGFRGNWGAEGKILVLLDGQETNETLYLTAQFGNKYPIEHIQRVEIMRGPGSAIYGGNAELAVINIVTRDARDFDGATVSGTYGQMESAFGRGSLSLYAGHVSESLGGLATNVAALMGQGRRSDQVYRDFYGNSYRLPNREDPSYLNVGAAWKGLAARFIYDRFHTTTRDAFTVSLPAPVATDFTNYYLELKYDWKLRDHLTVTPRFNYKRQTPWQVTSPDAGGPTYYDKTAQRALGGLRLNWDPTTAINVLVGTEYFFDHARLNRLDTAGLGLQQLFDGRETSSFHTVAVFAQTLLWHSIANLSVGARFEYNSVFGSTFLPRLAVTKAWQRLHLKLLASRAFKAPGHENLGLNPKLEPETTTTYELEVGCRLRQRWYLQVNAFHSIIERPIIFTYQGGRETYANFDSTGSSGLEAEVRFQHRRGRAVLRYSWYYPDRGTDVAVYRVPGHDDVMRGFAPHKLTLDGAVNLWRLTVAPSVIFFGPRYGALTADVAGVPQDGREDPKLLVNLFVTHRHLFVRGLEVGAGVFNLFDQKYRFLQPHDSGHAPLPGSTREWVVRVSYSHEFE